MIDSLSGLTERAAELRSAFDRAFAAPLRADAAVKQDLLAIRVGPEPFALRLAEVTGLYADRKITRVPGGKSELLGIAGFRGATVPVYSLRILLGFSAAPASRWLVIAVAAPVALAFDAFEGHLRAAADAILPQQSHAQMRGHAPEFIRTADTVRPVLHLASIVKALDASKPLDAAP